MHVFSSGDSRAKRTVRTNGHSIRIAQLLYFWFHNSNYIRKMEFGDKVDIYRVAAISIVNIP